MTNYGGESPGEAGDSAPEPAVDAVGAAPWVWDAGQARFIDDDLTGTSVLWGAPGTGKTVALLEKVRHAVEHHGVDPAKVLLLTPSRTSAARAREQLSVRLARTMSINPARTWSSYAFDVIRRGVAAGLIETGQRAPKLLSGAEQDVIIAQLLAGHGSGEIAAPGWPEGYELAVGTRAFRQEVRELFDRLNETGLDAEDLGVLGKEHGVPEWTAAAQLYGEYLDVLDLRMPEAFDPAQVMRVAIVLLRSNPQFLAAEQERLALIAVDDVQDATPAQLELLSLLRTGGMGAIVVTIAPDSTVQGFRGASAEAAVDMLDRWHEDGDVRDVVLEVSHRMPPEIAQAWLRVVGRIGVRAGAQRGRRVEDFALCEDAAKMAVRVEVTSSVHQEHRLIGSRIMDAHVEESVPFSQMAVIVRNSGMVQPLIRSLTQQGVPVRSATSSAMLASNRAAWAMLTVLRVAGDPDELTEELAGELLGTPFGESDAVRVRRLRHQLARAVAQSGERVPGDDARLLSRALVGELDIPKELGADSAGARRLAAMIAAGREALEAGHRDVELTLWSVWEAADVAKTWQRAALGTTTGTSATVKGHAKPEASEGQGSADAVTGRGGSIDARAATSLSAHDNLDAMLILFAAAERFNEQLAAASVEQFVDYVLGQEVPMDSLANLNGAGDAVDVMTVAASAGQSWDRVFVSGVQANVWPNTRIRGQVLRSADLAQLVQTGIMQTDYTSQVKDVMFDELKTFAVAISRARTHVSVTAVDAEDAAVSPFLDVIDPRPTATEARALAHVPRTKNLRSLVAALRQNAEAALGSAGTSVLPGHSDVPVGDMEAENTLAFLAGPGQRAEGAHPDTWWGLLPLSTDADIIAEGEAVPISPSRIQTAIDSPLNWFLSAAGGEVATDFARSLGTLIHEIAELLPAGTPPELSAKLEELWPRLGMPHNWLAEKDHERAQYMVDKLGRYINEDAPSSGRTLVGTEVTFRADVSSDDTYALLSGIVDRLERDTDGRLVVIDFKTGRSKPTAADIVELPQLAAYQVAVEHGAFGEDYGAESGGAALVQLGSREAKLAVQSQVPLAGEKWALELIHEAVDAMSGNSFESRHDPSKNGQYGSRCTVPWVCPLCEGEQVTE